ncbi:MAG TPA: hypothetical protein VEK80_10655 [Kribbellaceae bacterium]|nr:hypothetical protein [Kribbellaceae bacterium]
MVKPDEPDSDTGPEVTRLTPGKAADVGKNLKKGADALARSDFPHVSLTRANFGSAGKAPTLAAEYDLTYAVLAGTMSGFEADLNGFGDAVQHAADGLIDTDADNATMLNRMAAIIPTTNDHQAHDDAWRHQRDGSRGAH